MKKYIVLFLLAGFASMQAQDSNFDEKLRQLTREIDSIVQQKNNDLDVAIAHLNKQVENKEITQAEAENLKKDLVKKYADEVDYIIYKRTSELKSFAKTRIIERNVQIDDEKKDISYTIRIVKQSHKKHSDDKEAHHGTNSYFVMAIGVNNVIYGENPQTIEDSPYKIAGSRFFEMGIEWKTPIIAKKMFLRYGGSFVWNTLKPKERKIHEVINDTIQFVSLPYSMEESKLRNIWFRIPLRIELNLPRSRYNHLHLSAGVYGKIKMVSKQKIAYSDHNNSTEEVIKGNYNIKYFNYGLTGEIGGSWWQVYANYDLQPLFKNKTWHQVSLGLKIQL